MIYLKPYIKLARPHQYVKNIFLWLPLFFGYRLVDKAVIIPTLLAFIAFCFIASAVYSINDVMDVKEDCRHPKKRHRPVANGDISPKKAILYSIVLSLAAIVISMVGVSNYFLIFIGIYLVMNIAYSTSLKHIAILDVVLVSFSYVIRVAAGGFASGLVVSHWLYIMTFLLALFIAFAKRRDDLLLAEDGNATRKSIDGYNRDFLLSAMVLLSAVLIVSYILYTVSPSVMEKHGSNHLYITAFWVVLGLLRYLQVTFVGQNSGSPVRLLLSDKFLQISIMGWLLTFYILLYVPGI